PGDSLVFRRTGKRNGTFLVVRGVRDLDEFWEAYKVDGRVPDDLWEQVAEDIANEVLAQLPPDRAMERDGVQDGCGRYGSCDPDSTSPSGPSEEGLRGQVMHDGR